MRETFLFLIVLSFLFLPNIISAQTPNPTPPTADENDIVKISTTLIQVDATVTDKKGNIVRDLKPEDFEIYENGKKQEITNFSFISNASQNTSSQSTDSKSSVKEKNSIPLPPVKLKPEQVRRTYALIVDDLGLSFENIYWVKESLKKFINQQMQEGDLVAILRVSGGIGALQSFTSDKRFLLAAVSKIRWNGLGRVGVNSYEPIRNKSILESVNGSQNSDGSFKTAEGIEQNRESEAKTGSDYQANSAVGTLGALNYVIKGMRDLPGRKSLMLFSEGFQTFINRPGQRPETTKVYDSLRSLAEIANRSSVVIYTLDPRGVTIPGDLPMAADDLVSGGDMRLSVRGDSIRNSEDSLRYLARETGGISYNQNDLNYGIRKVLDDQQGFYLLGYQPDSESFDPKKSKFNRLSIKLTRPDLKIRYRSGFFGVTDEDFSRSNQSPNQKLTAALFSPFGANEINLDLYSIFYNDSKNRNFLRSLVYIEPKDLNFTLDPDGFYRTKFDIAAMIFDSNGASADNNINALTLQFTKEQFQKVQEHGIIYDLPTPITKTGAYQYRIALRDSATGKIGAASQFIEIPNLNKKVLTLSNLVVKGYSLPEWKKVSSGQNAASNKSILLDTVVRQFKKGTILTYSFVIYNAKINSNKKPDLQFTTRLFRDGKMILQGDPSPADIGEQNDLERISVLNAITLGTDLQPGDYVLQIVVSDNLAKGKNQIASQSLDFEIVN